MQTDESDTSSNIVSSHKRREQFGKSKQLSNPSVEKVGMDKKPSLEKVETDIKPSLETVGTDIKPSPDKTMKVKNEDKFPKPLIRKLSSSVSDEDTPVTGFMSKYLNLFLVIDLYKVAILNLSISLFVCPIITQEPLDLFASKFDWEIGNVLSLSLRFKVECG